MDKKTREVWISLTIPTVIRKAKSLNRLVVFRKYLACRHSVIIRFSSWNLNLPFLVLTLLNQLAYYYVTSRILFFLATVPQSSGHDSHVQPQYRNSCYRRARLLGVVFRVPLSPITATSYVPFKNMLESINRRFYSNSSLIQDTS